MLVRTSSLKVLLVRRQRIRLAVICTRAFLGNMQLVIGLKVYLLTVLLIHSVDMPAYTMKNYDQY